MNPLDLSPERKHSSVQGNSAHTTISRLGARHKTLTDVRSALRGNGSDAVSVDRHLSPPDNLQSFCRCVPVYPNYRAPTCFLIHREKAVSGRVGVLTHRVGWWKLELGHRVEELRRQLNQNARAVSAVGFAPNCAAMGEIAQDRERIVDNGMQVASRGVCYHGYTTRIGFLIGVVQAPRFRYSRKQHSATSTRTCSRRALVYQPITAGRESKTVTP